MNRRFFTLLFVTIALFFSCQTFKDDGIIYVFKGEVVSVADFKLKYNLWLRQNLLSDSLEMRKNYLFNELSNRLLYEMGMKEGVDNIPEIRAKIENFKKKTITEYMQTKTKKEIYSIDDETVRKYYFDHKDDFLRDKLYRLYAVRVNSKKKADKIVKQLREGSDIRMLAARFSDDKNLSKNNGDWGLFSPDIMDEPWKKDVMTSLPGEILGPYLDSKNFYTIIEIAGFAYKRHLTFNLAYPLIIEKLISQFSSKKWDAYRDTMITEYGAKINVKNLNWE